MRTSDKNVTLRSSSSLRNTSVRLRISALDTERRKLERVLQNDELLGLEPEPLESDDGIMETVSSASWMSLDKNVIGLILVKLSVEECSNARATCRSWANAEHPVLRRRLADARLNIAQRERIRMLKSKRCCFDAIQRCCVLTLMITGICFVFGLIFVAAYAGSESTFVPVSTIDFVRHASGSYLVKLQRHTNMSASCLQPIRPLFAICNDSGFQFVALHSSWIDFRCDTEIPLADFGKFGLEREVSASPLVSFRNRFRIDLVLFTQSIETQKKALRPTSES